MTEPSERQGRGGRERRGGRSGNAGRAADVVGDPFPFRQPRRRFPPVEIVSADEIEAIHQASLMVLEEIGMDFLDPDAVALLAKAGADTKPGSQRVRFDRNLILERIRSVPATFTLHARNPAHSLGFGGDQVIFA